jgi:tetratricopeptide (TPR) repeat protein
MSRKTLSILTCLCLIAGTAACYLQVYDHGFLNYDDPNYVTENDAVRQGLTWNGFRWALTTFHAANWHPLTWLSHMLDVTLFGPEAAGAHHLVNLLFHLANCVLLFYLLQSMTGALGASAVVATLFALHPLHVESVAWISERKDLLSTLCLLITLRAYLHYVLRPRPIAYLVTLLLFALGLMAKPMLVTLPFVLFLLDFWPLGRFGTMHADTDKACGPAPWKGWPGLVVEKAPFLALSAGACVVTFVAQSTGDAVQSLHTIALVPRLANIVSAYCAYLGKTLWPVDLAVFYPMPAFFSGWRVAACALLLLTISGLTAVSARRRPYLLVGWAWYLGTLVPVIGLVQVGTQAMADRYTYIPLIGIFITAAWLARKAVAHSRSARVAAALAAVALIAIMALQTHRQAGQWKSNETLFRHALGVTGDNAFAHNNLGNALDARGRFDEAFFHFSEAVRIDPGFATAYFNLGSLFDRQGRLEDALGAYTRATRLSGDYAEAHVAVGDVLSKQGRRDLAIPFYQKAVGIDRRLLHVWNSLGIAMAAEGRLEEAIACFAESIRGGPGQAEAHVNMAIALVRQGEPDEASRFFNEALAISPNMFEARLGLGNLLSRQGDSQGAEQQIQAALKIDPAHAGAHQNLGAILARRGDYRAAVHHFKAALESTPDSNDIRSNLIQALWLSGEKDIALGELERLRPSAPDLANSISDRLMNMLGTQ